MYQPVFILCSKLMDACTGGKGLVAIPTKSVNNTVEGGNIVNGYSHNTR